MKNRVKNSYKFFILLLLILSYKPLFSQNLGVGGVIGNPTGVSAKYWLNEIGAIDAGVGWSAGKNNYMQVHSDYLYHRFGVLDTKQIPIPLYIGAGARLKFGKKDNIIGVRVPLGLAFIFRDIPIDVFAEIAPVGNFYPKASFDADGGVGVRYFF